MDQARTGEPGGFLDTIGAIRDGALADQGGEEKPSKEAAVERSWGPGTAGQPAQEEDQQEVTLLPSPLLARPLRPGDELSFLVDGKVHQVRILELPGTQVGAVEYCGQRHDVATTNRTEAQKTD